TLPEAARVEPAVSAVLPGVVCQVTARDDLRDWPVFARLSSEPEDRFSGWRCSPEQAEPWLTQAPGFTNLRCQNTVITAISALILGSTFNSEIRVQ
ncbi:MAG: hypothetical protein LKH97_07525, partial [Levilactobacillus sp.]|nr:hypothetical protein [Levilactobacillus sp.]